MKKILFIAVFLASCSKTVHDQTQNQLLCSQVILLKNAEMELESKKLENRFHLYSQYEFVEGKLSDSGKKCVMVTSQKLTHLWKDAIEIDNTGMKMYSVYDLTKGTNWQAYGLTYEKYLHEYNVLINDRN